MLHKQRMLDLDARQRLVGEHDILGDLPTAAQRELAAAMRQRTVPARTTLFVQGAVADDVYLLVAGDVHIALYGQNGASTLLDIMRSGELFGEIGVLNGGTRTATAFCHSRCELLAVRGNVFHTLIRAHGQVIERLLDSMIKRVCGLTDLAECLMLRSEQRIAFVVLRLAQRHGKVERRGTLIGTRLTEGTIAQLAQVSRQTVSTTLATFRRRGLVERCDHGLLVIEHHALLALVERTDGL